MTPVVFFTNEDSLVIDDLSSCIKEKFDKTDQNQARLLLSFPVVYIHFWPGAPIEYISRDGALVSKKQFNVYVGETNDIVARTKEHYVAGANPANWQCKLVSNRSISLLIVIGHSHFNKSFTLDLENRLIDYIAPGNNIQQLFNARGNPQNGYYPVEEFDNVFHSVWKELRKVNKDLFRCQKLKKLLFSKLHL